MIAIVKQICNNDKIIGDLPSDIVQWGITKYDNGKVWVRIGDEYKNRLDVIESIKRAENLSK